MVLRTYLLGTVARDQAVAIEKRYFTSLVFFRQIRNAEQSLIRDYLDDRLEPDERQRFESRYLQLPVLERIVEEVRKRRRAGRGNFGSTVRWRLVAAGALFGGLGFGSWVYYRQQNPVALGEVSQRKPDSLAAVNVRLTPGSRKGADSGTAQFALRASTFPVRFIAELPGQLSVIECVAAISVVGLDGIWTRTWSSNRPFRSTPASGGQLLALVLDSSVFHAGDYMLQLSTPDGRIGETYLFRVTD